MLLTIQMFKKPLFILNRAKREVKISMFSRKPVMAVWNRYGFKERVSVGCGNAGIMCECDSALFHRFKQSIR